MKQAKTLFGLALMLLIALSPSSESLARPEENSLLDPIKNHREGIAF